MYKSILIICFLFVFLVSCNKTEGEDVIEPKSKGLNGFSSELSFEYLSLYVDVIKHSDGYRPPISARALAYMNLGIYEAVAGGFTKNNSIFKSISSYPLKEIDQKKSFHWGIVANSAYFFGIKYFLQTTTQQDDIKSQNIYEKYNNIFKTETDTAKINRSIKHGQDIVYAMYLYSLEDGQSIAYRNNKPTDYQPPVGPSFWRSTGPDFLRALTPRWGQVRTFMVKPDKANYKDPIAFDTKVGSAFYKEAQEVYNAVKNKTTESVWIAEFWSDDLNNYSVDAAGRWINIAINFMKNNKTNLETAILINAKLSIALHDAAVNCWDEKYHYNLLRPVSYINDYIDPNWKSILRDPTKPVGQQIGVTPQHPAYPSGHSVFGAVAAEILIAEFGDKINFTDRTHEGETFFDGKPRTFTSFTQMADENAYSRIPLGVHYRMDCVEGLRLGKMIGKKINAAAWKMIL